MRFATIAPPLRTTFCHCRFCQRVTGAAYASLVFFNSAEVVWTSGDPARYSHISEGSGHPIDVHFCATCGATLAFCPGRFPGIIGMHRQAFERPDDLLVNPATDKHIFLESAHPDTLVPVGLPLYWQHAMGPDGAPTEPLVLTSPSTVAELRNQR